MSRPHLPTLFWRQKVALSGTSGRSERVARTLCLGAVVLAVAVGCSSKGTGGSAATTTPPPTTTPLSATLLAGACASTLRVEDAGTVTDPEIDEASGIAASRRNPGLWWVNNDSGDTARFFAIDVTGQLRATEDVDGATATDWEDLAVGPPTSDGGGETLYLADIGDNASARTSVQVYRLPEPAVATGGTPTTGQVTAEQLTFTYPDGPHDAETLMVDPLTNDLIIVTKDWTLAGHSEVFRAPGDLAAGSTTVLEKEATLDLPNGALVTSGDVTSDGTLVGLRSYGGVSLYPCDPSQPLWSAFSATPCNGPLPIEKQGEALGFTVEGGAYATISEGTTPILHLTHPGA